MSALRFHRLNKIRDAFLTWKILWGRKRELMQFEDTVQCKGNDARKRRIFNHWKHCILLEKKQRQQQQQQQQTVQKYKDCKTIKLRNKTKTVLKNHILL